MKELYIRKFQLIKMLEIAKEHYGLNTIDEMIEDINNHLLNDTDIAVRFTEDEEAIKEIESIE